MTREEFGAHVAEIEKRYAPRPAALRLRIFWLAVVGYTGMLAWLGTVCLLAALFLIPGIRLPLESGWFLLIAAWTSAILITAMDIYGVPDSVRQAWQVIFGAAPGEWWAGLSSAGRHSLIGIGAAMFVALDIYLIFHWWKWFKGKPSGAGDTGR